MLSFESLRVNVGFFEVVCFLIGVSSSDNPNPAKGSSMSKKNKWHYTIVIIQNSLS